MLTKSEAIADFLKTTDTLAYPQPLVAEAIKAKQTDLNKWRSRGLMIGWEKETTNVEYTGRGLIAAGWMNELAFVIGPARASFLSQAMTEWLFTSYDMDEDDMVIELRRSFDEMAEDDEHTEWVDLGLHPVLINRKAEGRVCVDERMIAFAFTQLSADWAITARLLMERTDA